MLNFSDFNFHPAIMDAIDGMGYRQPTPIQEATIPLINEGNDVIACAQTGTGKTAAYLLPVLNRMLVTNGVRKGITVLIIVPTRELALQIDQQLQGLSWFAGVSSATIYGGGDAVGWDVQKKAIVEGTDVLIATPGRLISHINLGYVNLQTVQFLILDEADKMLDMGFYDDLMKIIGSVSDQRQSLLFSATMPDKIRQLARKIMKHPKEISLAVSKPAEGILQAAYLAEDEHKIPLLVSLLHNKNDLNSIIIFCSTKKDTRSLEKELKKSGLSTRAIHSDLDQSEREDVMRDFRNRKFKIMVATDILSRGIDIESIDLIINYNVPSDAEDYIHRIGRTARAEAEGIAITLVNRHDRFKFKRIEKFLEQEIYKIPLPLDITQNSKQE